MSIFIALQSFKHPEYQNEAKFATLIASILAGVSSFLLLRLYNNIIKGKIAINMFDHYFFKSSTSLTKSLSLSQFLSFS